MLEPKQTPPLDRFWSLPAPQVLEQLGGGPRGLSRDQAARARYGPNTLRPPPRFGAARLLLKQGQFGAFPMEVTLVPELPFLFLSGLAAVGLSVALSTLGLCGIGAATTLLTGRSVWYTILALLTIAMRQADGQWRRRLPDAETAGGAN